MKKRLLFAFFVAVLMSSFIIFAGAASEYNYKGFQLYIPSEFIQDINWAKKYNYVDYWHTDDYMIEMVLIDTDFPEGEFMDKHPDEPHYDCHIIHDKIYGYSSHIVSEEDVEFNGNAGKKMTYKKEVSLSEDDEWEVVNVFRYVFEEGDKYYEVCFYIHHEQLYSAYPDMIMQSFNISPFTFFLRNRTWILAMVISPIAVTVTGYIKRRKNKII